jgi:hypothetical protein
MMSAVSRSSSRGLVVPCVVSSGAVRALHSREGTGLRSLPWRPLAGSAYPASDRPRILNL